MTTKRQFARQRRGLAPLEFLLWLPVLLFVMALMVNFGTIAAWRLRGEVVSRDAVWRERFPRTGRNEPRPPGPIWPVPARMEVHADDPLALLDDPEIDHEVVRGPLPNGFDVRQILDPDRTGAVRGESEIERKMPLLPKLGNYHSGDIKHQIVEPMWQSVTQGIPNSFRRIKILYVLPKASAGLPQAFANSVVAVMSMANKDGLDVLDRDADVKKYHGHYVDFHPRARYLVELDREIMKENAVKRHLTDFRDEENRIRLGRVTQLPRALTAFFLGMYKSRINNLENLIEQLQERQKAIPNHVDKIRRDMGAAPVDQRQSFLQQIASLQSMLASIPGQINSASSEIAVLQPKVDQLEGYQKKLPGIETDLKSTSTANR